MVTFLYCSPFLQNVHPNNGSADYWSLTLPGPGPAHTPDKVISVCNKTLPHPRGSRRCYSMCFKESNTHQLTVLGCPACQSLRQFFAHSKTNGQQQQLETRILSCCGKLAAWFLQIYEGRRIRSLPCVRI